MNITLVDRPIYDDVFLSGDNKRQVKAPILGFYKLTFKDPNATFVAEVRLRPHPDSSAKEYCEQVDWYDDLDDYLFKIESRDEANELRESISMSIYLLRNEIPVGSTTELAQWGRFQMWDQGQWKISHREQDSAHQSTTAP